MRTGSGVQDTFHFETSQSDLQPMIDATYEAIDKTEKLE